MIVGLLMRHGTGGRIRENSEKPVSAGLGAGITSLDGRLLLSGIGMSMVSTKATEIRQDLRRSLRAIAALEHIGNSQAHEILEVLARGEPSAPVTLEAAAALARRSRKR
jgi:hypothetical protein